MSAAPINLAAPVVSAVTAPSTPVAGNSDFLAMLTQHIVAAPANPMAKVFTQQSTSSLNSESVDALEVPVEMIGAFLPAMPIVPFTPPVEVPATDALVDMLKGIQRHSPDAILNEMQILGEVGSAEQLTEIPADFDALLSPLSTSEHSATRAQATEAAIHRPMQQPVGSSAWADEVGSRLALMAEQGKHSASIRLSPEHLGPLEIRISVREDQASVWFGAAHADTRAAIEHALPRLRELFESQGMSLADAGVYREAPRQPSSSSGTSMAGSGEPAADPEPVAIAARVLGLVDAYA